jgi:redox-sensing transcriptional repressor
MHIGIGIITVPVEYAQSVADRLVEAGVKAIWNFTPIRISAPEDVVISNTSIYAHLAVMYNRMNG